MRTPIIKVKDGKKIKPFYTQKDAKEYIEKFNIKRDNIKYYKGLGTSTSDDIKEDFGKRLVNLELDDSGDKMMQNIFGKDNTEFRKQWMSDYDPNSLEIKPIKDYEIEQLSITNFLNYEMILFSIEDCKRSIPHLLDGLKESQRKVLYSAFKRNLKYSGKTLKVAQFAGFVAETSNYHHGEQNLYETIIKMAQRFTGSNNIPLLFNEGAFGTRLHNGDDAASARYIFTKLDLLTRYIFREEDEPFLEDTIEEGETIEKCYYIPIIPMILVNGCSGIGSGWSSNIPQYNPLDLVENIKAWIDGKELNEFVPWYRNFKGNILVDGNKITTFGCFEKIDSRSKEDSFRITELPIGKKNISINKYKLKLEDLKEQGLVKTIKNYSDDEVIDYHIKCSDNFDSSSNGYEQLGLTDTLHTSNMVLFTSSSELKNNNDSVDKSISKIKRYTTVKDIFIEFCEKRLHFYSIRKSGQLSLLKDELKLIQNKIRFIQLIINNEIQLKDRTDDSLEEELIKRKFDKKISESGKESYDYLLSIQVRSMTGQRLNELQKEEKDLIETIKSYEKKTIQMLWLNDLNDFTEKYKEWSKILPIKQDRSSSQTKKEERLKKKK